MSSYGILFASLTRTLSVYIVNRFIELDKRFQLMVQRHCDPNFLKHTFTSGVSSLTTITAVEFVPLLWQMCLALGTQPDTQPGGAILPYEMKIKVVQCCYELLVIREMLWKPEHTAGDMADLDHNIPMYVLCPPATSLVPAPLTVLPCSTTAGRWPTSRKRFGDSVQATSVFSSTTPHLGPVALCEPASHRRRVG